MSIMSYIEIKKLIHYIVFIDSDETAYYFHGRFETSVRDLCVTVMDYCNNNNIACNYVYRNKKENKYSITITPYSVEEAWKLFHQPFMRYIFSVDDRYFFTKYNKQN